MRIVIASIQVPFVFGGATYLAQDLREQLRLRSHTAELVTLPFRFSPPKQIERSIEIWQGEDFDELNMIEPDLVIPLTFPSYYCKHARIRPWLMHQFRSAYEFYTQDDDSPLTSTLRDQIVTKDSLHLSRCERVFTISRNVSHRLFVNNAVASEHLYPPAPYADRFYSGDFRPYIFSPGRLESLKRQHLLIDAIHHVQSPAVFLIAGMGGQYGELMKRIERENLGNRVRLLGTISEAEKYAYYANCSGVFFGPQDEDYGYVTLEAMLASKPVITCTDSGGPLEFVLDRETGLITSPDAKEIAQAIDSLIVDDHFAKRLGDNGRERYEQMNLSWDFVIETLLGQ